MILKALDAKSNKVFFECSVEGTLPSPATGDIFVAPNSGVQYRVLQRAYIGREIPHQGPVLDFNAPKVLDFEVQLACCPAGMEAEYLQGGNNAVN